jgi:multisubunit Na+/H+ antiporter MnhB subunit
MKAKKLSLLSSILIALSAVLVVLSLYFPWWQMIFFAPQYPEGLNIIVYPNKLGGEIDIVNGLNHYIGMENFSEENFPELAYLSYLVIGLAVITFLTAILRKKSVLYGFNWIVYHWRQSWCLGPNTCASQIWHQLKPNRADKN